MYNTPAGNRVLTGPEKRLFTESLGVMIDLLSDGDFDFGIAVFDRLQRNQKIGELCRIARVLLQEVEPAPTLTASIEAAVASVYQHAREMLVEEIEEDTSSSDITSPTWRELTLTAARDSDALEDFPHPLSDDKEEWDLLILCLESQVLWDDDWAMEKGLDIAPENSRRLKEQLGIPDDYYYVAVPSDPTDEQMVLLLEELRRLTPEGR